MTARSTQARRGRAAPGGRPRPHFTPALFAFLKDLAAHNDRAWFQAHKDRFEVEVKGPLLGFITDFAPRLAAVSRHFKADRGSMFRIHRDTRFSRDKRPYKTHVAAQFRHRGPGEPLPKELRDPALPFGAPPKPAGVPAGGNVHGPGFYLHLEPGEVFMAAGLWRPERDALKAIRDRIAACPDAWRRARNTTLGACGLYPDGESLQRPPRGYDPDHPLIDDLKRKDFIVVADLSQAAACRADFIDRYAECCKAAAPYVRFLTQAVGLPW